MSPQTETPPIYVWEDILHRHALVLERVDRDLRRLNKALLSLAAVEKERDAFIARHGNPGDV